ncbi:MAG: O-antigen ligase family protein [Bacteroidota bacterium]
MVARWAKQVNLSLFFVLCAFPLLKPHLISLVSIAMLCSGFIYLIASREWKFDTRFLLLMSAIVIPYFFGLWSSHNISYGITVVQVKMMMLMLGVHFGFVALRPTTKQQLQALNIFCVAALLIAVIGNLLIAIKGYTIPIGVNGADFAFSYRIALETYIGLHPTYYCAIVYMAAFIKLYQILDCPFRPSAQNWGWLVLIILCVAAGLLAASRATMIAFAVVTAIYIFNIARTHPYRWWFVGGLVVIAVSLSMVPSIKARLLEINAANMQAPGPNNDNGTNVRSGIFTCNAELLKEHWVWGLGTGNVQDALNTCLGKFDTNVYESHDYNTHNEYLNSWLTAGVLGLLSFVGTLLYSFWLAFRSQNHLHVYFLAFMCICFLTENYLERQAGVTLFALMQMLFLAVNHTKEKEMA